MFSISPRIGLATWWTGTPPGKIFRKSLVEWAKGAENVILYLVDHGGESGFSVREGEIVSPGELDGWLDELEGTITGKVLVVIDACQSGWFLQGLASSSGKRVVIASTRKQESAYFIASGSISFSTYFWTHVFNGANLLQAFTQAKADMAYSTGMQHPLLDANGNGKGNEAEDKDIAAGIVLFNATNSFNEAPTIGTVTPPRTITGTSSALIYADQVRDADGIGRVFAIVRPPDFQPSGTGSPILELPTIELFPVGGERYEGLYDGFHATGDYQVFVYARDRIGNTSAPKHTTITVESPLTRKAVIVAGPAQGELWDAIEKSAGQAYGALKSQGYQDDDIAFYSPVTFVAGVDGTPTLSNVEYAVQDWAALNTQDLVVYLIGEKAGGSFVLDGADRLSGTAAQRLSHHSPGKGSRDEGLGRLRRLSIGWVRFRSDRSRADRDLEHGSDQAAHFDSGGDVSFSHYFWNQVSMGAGWKTPSITPSLL